MPRSAWLGLLLAACGSAAPAPDRPAPPTPAPLPGPADIRGALAGDVPGTSGAPVVHVRVEVHDGVKRVDGVYVTRGAMACGDLLEEHPGIRAHVRGDADGPVLPLFGGFHRSTTDSPDASGWVALDPGELVPGGQVHGKLFLRTTGAGAARVAGEFTATVCLPPPEFAASSDLAITIDGMTTHATFAHARLSFGHTTFELASTLSEDGEHRGSDATGIEILDLPPTPEGAFFEGARFAPSLFEVFTPAIPEGVEVRGLLTVAPFAFGEYAHLVGSLTVPSGKAYHSAHVVKIDGRFDAQLGDNQYGFYDWLAAQHLPDGPPTVHIGTLTAAVRAARVTTTHENGESIDQVELVDTADPCAADAHVLAHFDSFGAVAALGPPTHEHIGAEIDGQAGGINGWVAIATAPTVHGWVFAIDPPYDPRVKADRIEVAGHFDAKACATGAKR